MNSTAPIIHIGYPKAGSTTLQKHLFDKHPEIIFLGIYPMANIGRDTSIINHNSRYLMDERLKSLHQNLVMQDTITYKFSETSTLWQNIYDEYVKKNRQIVLSNERFTSVYFAHPDIGLKLERLKTLIPEAKVFLVIRNQISLAISQYRDHPFDPRFPSIGQPMSVDKWFQIAMTAEDCHLFSTLDYYRIVTYLWQLFGEDNVGIFLFEEFVNDFPTFAHKLSQFMHIDAEQTLACLQQQHENIGVSAAHNLLRQASRQHKLIRGGIKFIPPVFKSVGKNLLEKLPKQKVELSMPIKTQTEDVFADCNTRLTRVTDLDLSRFQYPL